MLSNDALLKLAVEASTGFAIFALDASGRVTSWNYGAERLLGHTDREIMRCDCTPQDRAHDVGETELAPAASQGRAVGEHWHVRRDSSRSGASGPLMQVPGQPSFRKIMRDQTAKHRAEELLEEAEARFRILATAIPAIRQLVFTCQFGGTASREFTPDGVLRRINVFAAT